MSQRCQIAGEKDTRHTAGTDLLLSRLPLVLEVVPPFAVKRSDAVQGADNQQGPGDADSNGGQHPGHVTRLEVWRRVDAEAVPSR